MSHKDLTIARDQDGAYHCFTCGHRWHDTSRRLWWPIRFKWSRLSGFGRHGVEVGSDGPDRRVVRQVFSFWRFRILLGPDKYNPPVVYLSHVEQWWTPRMITRFKQVSREREHTPQRDS